jgi:hypothetical protein
VVNYLSIAAAEMLVGLGVRTEIDGDVTVRIKSTRALAATNYLPKFDRELTTTSQSTSTLGIVPNVNTRSAQSQF